MTVSCFLSPEELYDKLKSIDVANPLCTYTLEKCQRLAPLVNRILALKAEKNAVLLAHYYVHSDITYGVADFVGDSYGLAKAAKSTAAERIVFPAVRFMAETAKLLNPDKIVIDPNPNGGCSLADSIDAETVYRLRDRYPNHLFICYINTTAAVKAACDVCVTSSNAEKILATVPSDKIFFLPDRYMAENLAGSLRAKGIDKEILAYEGACYVHEQFDPEAVRRFRSSYPDSYVLAHPECKNNVARIADYVGSTTGMVQFVTNRQEEKKPFLLLTECGIAARLQVETPKAKIVGSCMVCKYMRSNSLISVRQALEDPIDSQIIEIDPLVQKKALECITAMFTYAER